MGNYFRRWEDDRFFLRLVAAASQLRTFHKCLNDHFFRFSESFDNGRLDLFFCLHFCNAKARTSQTGLDKTRQTDLLYYIFVGNRLSLTQQQRFGNTYAKSLQILIAGKFIVCNSSRQYSTTGIRNAQHIKISLQTTILTRCAMNRNISKIEHHLFRSVRKTKIISVHRNLVAVR